MTIPSQFEEWFAAVWAGSDGVPVPPYQCKGWDVYIEKRQIALGAWVAALESALAASAEPVAWRLRIGDSDMWSYCANEMDADFHGVSSGLTYFKEPMYAHAQPAAKAEPVATVQKSRDRVKLWFFRDMTDAQRIELLKLFGFTVDDMGTHGAQTHCLRYIFEALYTHPSPVADAEALTHEVKRWCHGDGDWSNWQPCTAKQAEEYAKDDSVKTRPRRLTGSQP